MADSFRKQAGNLNSQSFTRLACLAVFHALCLCLSLSAIASEQALRFGVVPQFEARQIREIWQPVLDAIEKSTGIHIDLVGSPNIPEFERQFMAGEFDLAYMNPYHMLEANKTQGYEPLVRDVGKTLHGIVVTSKNSPARNVQDLDGKIIAFPAPNALGASLIPRAEFSEIYGISIQPKYVRSHDSVYLNVVTGQTYAGGGVQKTFQEQPENIRDALKIIYKTQQVSPHPVAIHPRVSTANRDRIREAFLLLGNTPEGSDLLARIPIEKVGQASLHDYEPLRRLGLDRYYVK